MKKTVTAIVAGALFLTLAGCPKKPDDTASTDAMMGASDAPMATDMGTDSSSDMPMDSAS